jgi:hypothetical protein
MSETLDQSPPSEPQDARIDLLRRALELSGVEPLVAASLAREHYIRITADGPRFEVSDPEGRPYDKRQAHEDPILHLAERIKEGIPAKFLTEDVSEDR